MSLLDEALLVTRSPRAEMGATTGTGGAATDFCLLPNVAGDETGATVLREFRERRDEHELKRLQVVQRVRGHQTSVSLDEVAV